MQMQPLTRFRIIIFALMIFGAFASFAQNEWGNLLVFWCQLIIGGTFVYEIKNLLLSNINNKNKFIKYFLKYSAYITFISYCILILILFLVQYFPIPDYIAFLIIPTIIFAILF